MSGNLSVGHCLQTDVLLIGSLFVSAHHRCIKDIIVVHWKAPSPPWLKVNTYGSVVGNHATCGVLFRDHLGIFLCTFACNLGIDSIFSSKIQGFLFALEFAAQNGWSHIWLESDSTSALMAFKKPYVIPVLIRNRWHNACRLGVQVISSDIYREGNYYAYRLANIGHAVQGVVWLSALPSELFLDFFQDICSLSNYRFP